MASEERLIHVEVVYALPQEQKVLKLAVQPNTPVQEIIEQSGILTQYPDIDYVMLGELFVVWLLSLVNSNQILFSSLVS